MSRDAGSPGGDAISVLLLVGPTGSGKTEISLLLAQCLDAEIVCGDSRQIYRGLDAATGKPTASQRESLPHHLFDRFDVGETVSAGRFARVARPELLDIARRGRLPMVVGGAGLYLKALYRGLAPIPEIPIAVRQEIRDQIRRRGPEALHGELATLDPASAARLSRRGGQRIARAIEVVRFTGRTLSAWHESGVGEATEPPIRWHCIGLECRRQALYAALDRRTRAFFEGELLDECRGFLDAGFSPDAPALRTLGYRQALRHLGGHQSYADALVEAQRETRRYAKRQLTWWRQEGPRIDMRVLELSGDESLEAKVCRAQALWRQTVRSAAAP